MVVETKDGKIHKLINRVLNKMTLTDLANEINYHTTLKVYSVIENRQEPKLIIFYYSIYTIGIIRSIRKT